MRRPCGRRYWQRQPSPYVCHFPADVGTPLRFLERILAAVMNRLYAQPPPFCDVPDRGMMLAPRRPSEEPMADSTGQCNTLSAA